jgi:hypothetical protein
VDGSSARKSKYHPENSSFIIRRAGHPGQNNTGRSVEGREKQQAKKEAEKLAGAGGVPSKQCKHAGFPLLGTGHLRDLSTLNVKKSR